MKISLSIDLKHFKYSPGPVINVAGDSIQAAIIRRSHSGIWCPPAEIVIMITDDENAARVQNLSNNQTSIILLVNQPTARNDSVMESTVVGLRGTIFAAFDNLK